MGSLRLGVAPRLLLRLSGRAPDRGPVPFSEPDPTIRTDGKVADVTARIRHGVGRDDSVRGSTRRMRSGWLKEG